MIFKKILILLVALAAGGCQNPAERDFLRAKEEASSGNYRIALSFLDKTILRNEESAEAVLASREAARIAFFEVKDYARAADYYKQLVVHSTDSEERVQSQKQIAVIYFEHLTDYAKAIIEINRLLTMLNNPSEKVQYKKMLAKAYYYQNNFDQSLNEVEEFLRTNRLEENELEMLMLKGNILLAKKDLASAAMVYKEILRKFPQKAKEEKVGLTLALCLEEMQDYRGAIAALEELRPTHPVPEYIDLRITRLKERLKNQPGARGFRK